VSDSWTPTPDPGQALGNPAATGGYTSLPHVTLYTSLESCSQCSGVMALAEVKQVVYLQTDPGMYFIGRILRNLTTENLRAPLPIAAGEVDLDYFEVLNKAYGDFVSEVPQKPFWIGPDGTPDATPSVTSFLCTGHARGIFASGADLLDRLIAGKDPLAAPDFKPSPNALSNNRAIGETAQFLDYAIRNGRRGTPHNL
jgi:hypothetical protein